MLYITLERSDTMPTEILTPSPNGENCIYNGTNENYECACDECEYFLECFSKTDK